MVSNCPNGDCIRISQSYSWKHQFVAASNFDVSLGIDGLRFESATSKWLQGGVRILAKRKWRTAFYTYPLYKDISSAETGVTGNPSESNDQLCCSTNLPSISKGSVVLYRQFEVVKLLAWTESQ